VLRVDRLLQLLDLARMLVIVGSSSPGKKRLPSL
jgi:hypothetical protein